MIKKTHTEVKDPHISTSRLADYMAASEQMKRTIIQSCKYRAIARVFQHGEAKAIVANHIRSGEKNAEGLIEKANFVRNKLADDDFEEDTNEHNADYIDRFAEVCDKIKLPPAELSAGKKFPPLEVEGVLVSFRPQLLLRRLTKTNKIRSGALMLRYAKGKALVPAIAMYQCAAIFRYMRTLEKVDMAEAERPLCITLDAYKGVTYEAPGNAIYLINEMTAACKTIGEWWPTIKPPKNAIL